MTTTKQELKTELFEEYNETVHGNLLCNQCGNSCVYSDNFGKVEQGLIETIVDGGYFSKHLEDFKRYRFSLCEKCVSKMFENFKTKPLIKDYASTYDIDFKDRVLYLNRLYEKMYKTTIYYDPSDSDAKFYRKIKQKLEIFFNDIENIVEEQAVQQVMK